MNQETKNRLSVIIAGETDRSVLIQLANSTNSKKALINKDWLHHIGGDFVIFKDKGLFIEALKAFN